MIKFIFIMLIAFVYGTDCKAQRVGDVMPFYDASSSKFYIYYLRDIWSDASNQRHPWNALTTTTLSSYTQVGEKLSCSTDPCKQDFAIGTGSVIKNGSTYYAFYTGHNPNAPSGCAPKKEGIMLATTTSLANKFTKSTSFATIYPPSGYDAVDNFRDPYVFKDGSTFYMLVSARTSVNGTWRGVIAKYTSTNLTNWSYNGILYDGGAINYFMMECAQIFKMGTTYYLIFSDINSKKVIYRKSSSVNGPWGYPVGTDILNNVGYAASSASNGTSRYIWGWKVTTGWAGDLIDNRLTQATNGDLIVSSAGSATGGRIAGVEDEVVFNRESKNESIKVYPNPIDDTFTVDISAFTDKEQHDVSLQVVNMDGKIFEDKDVSDSKTVTISTKSLGMQSGLYVVKIRSAKRQGSIKIAIQ